MTYKDYVFKDIKILELRNDFEYIVAHWIIQQDYKFNENDKHILTLDKDNNTTVHEMT